MARETFEDWIPTEMGPAAIKRLQEKSAVEALGRPEPMQSDTKQVPRAGDFTVANIAKGAAYAESTTTNDYVELIARKAGGAVRIAEEDLTDTVMGERLLTDKQSEAATALAKYFDNATLAVTAAANGTTIPYESVYKAVRTTDASVAEGSYTADTNYVATAGAVTYQGLSDFLALLEGNQWVDSDNLVVIAHPAFKGAFRSITDENGVPIWRNGLTEADPGTLMGYTLRWSMGAKTHATATQTPGGNPILVAGDADKLIVGKARLSSQIATSNPGFAIQRAATGVGFLTDEALMKAVMRRGFVVGHPGAFAVMEKTAA